MERAAHRDEAGLRLTAGIVVEPHASLLDWDAGHARSYLRTVVTVERALQRPGDITPSSPKPVLSTQAKAGSQLRGAGHAR